MRKIKSIKKIRRDLVKALDKKINVNKDRISIYGAGNSSQLAEESFILENIKPLYFIDNYNSNSNFVMNIPIITYEDAKSICKNSTILVCSGNEKTCRSILKMINDDPIEGTNVYLYDEYVFIKNKEKIINNFDLLVDDLSKRTYANMILSRMLIEKQNYDLVVNNQYFAIPSFSLNNTNEVFVDCGSFVGDTIEEYLFIKEGIFNKIYSFEPEHKNYLALSNRTDRLKKEWALSDNKIELYECGLGESEFITSIRQVSNDGPSLGSSISNIDNFSSEGGYIRINTLNSIFEKQRVSFIKADVESYEKRILIGGTKIIKRDIPRLAICIYHNATDMYDIIDYIRNTLGYNKLYIRQHEYTFAETVLYAEMNDN